MVNKVIHFSGGVCPDTRNLMITYMY